MAAFSDVDINISGAAAAVLLTPQEAGQHKGQHKGEHKGENGQHTETHAENKKDHFPAADKPAAAATQAASPPAAGEWAEEQEVALVKALKLVDKAASDRWEQVAAMVPGKSKAACFRRFKELKENFRAKKTTV